ncbi:uncharacterized protein LOC115920705 [Strongylocentrotus purpuratus]|uniref:Uncharacterized protein n=1 Tax=Strongylocentrotus purpuratus TaxID=7668 RepID=A0A7M7SUT9_STRPU|nr:uncharacterized protein LOC115920705 [Strongylocentrotus purpuratus]
MPLEHVIGGVIGSLVIIILLIFTALMYKRIKQRRLKAEPITSPPNNAPEPSVEYENPVFDDTKQDPHNYENLNPDDHAYQDLNTETPKYQNLTDPHIYQALKKPNINVTCQDVTKSDPGDTYEEV